MKSFLQSVEWQEIQERMGRRTERVGPHLFIQHDLPFGFHYWYAPRPLFTSEILLNFGDRARAAGALFFKVDPAGENTVPSGLARQARSLQPQQTIFVHANPDDVLQSSMHSKTRYNIRLAERHSVRMRPTEGDQAVASFKDVWPLFRETAARDGFHLHPRHHYESLFRVRSPAFRNELWTAEYHGEPVASAIINWYGPSGTATYLHGASSSRHRNVMAPYLLHWNVIRSLAPRSFKSYDFGGIDEALWPGVTRFKTGFGGESFAYPASFDYITRPSLYRAYSFQRWLRGGVL